MKNLTCFIFLILVISISSFATINTDSLKTALETVPADDKINIYEQLINSLTRPNPEEAIVYSKALITLADSLNNNEALALGYRLLGKVYEYQHRYDLSLDIWKKNLEIEKKLKNRKNQAYSTINIGSSLQHLSRYDEALYYFGEAQVILEEINDLRGQGYNYGNIGLVYEKKGMLPEALGYKIKALQIVEKLADSSNIAYSLGSVAVCQTNLRDYQKAIHNYTQAIQIYESIGKPHNAVHTLTNLGVAYNSLGQNQEAMESFRKGLALSKSIKYKYGQAIVEMNLGEVLLKNNKPDSAMFYLDKSNATFLKLNDPHPLCYNYKLMGSYYQKAGDFSKAIDFLIKTYNLSHEIQAPDMHRDAAKILSEAYEESGQTDLALQYYKTFKHYSDSLFNAKNVAETTRLEAQYHFEKDQAETEILHQAKLSKKQSILISVSSGLAVVIALLLLLFIEYRRKNAAYKALYRKNMEQLENSLSRKKNDILKNGDLFIEIERRMQEDKLFKQKDLSRDTIAEQLGSNREYVHQALKDHANKTVSEYISNWRINEAKKILSDPESSKGKSMQDISDEIGMSATSTSTFYTLFNKFSGMTPAQFRKQSQTKI